MLSQYFAFSSPQNRSAYILEFGRCVVSRSSQQEDRRGLKRLSKSRRNVVFAAFAGALAVAVVGAVTTVVGDGAHWFDHKVVHPEKYLFAKATLISAGRTCEGEKGWIFNGSPTTLPVPNDTSPQFDAESWAKEYKGVPASGYYFQVALQAQASHTVIITAMDAIVVHRQSVPNITTAPRLTQECGGIEPYLYEVNLDHGSPSFKAVSGQGSDGSEKTPVPLPHKVQESDPEVWQVSATTKTCICSWTLRIHWTSDGKDGVTNVTDNGRAFQVEAGAGARDVETDGAGGSSWIK